MFPQALLSRAANILERARQHGLRIVTAESCTGGLIAGLLTEIPGSSDVFERGFVTYSYQSKEQMLGVSHELLAGHGAVNAETARQMAHGALAHSGADLVVAVTGIAGPGGGTSDKPVGLVHIAVGRGGDIRMEEHRFGNLGRTEIRLKTVAAALSLLETLL
jgi:nicotinamide-nucleotide amidase